MKNAKSFFVYPKYSSPITQGMNVAFTIRDCSVSSVAGHNLACRARWRVAFATSSGKTVMQHAVPSAPGRDHATAGAALRHA